MDDAQRAYNRSIDAFMRGKRPTASRSNLGVEQHRGRDGQTVYVIPLGGGGNPENYIRTINEIAEQKAARIAGK